VKVTDHTALICGLFVCFLKLQTMYVICKFIDVYENICIFDHVCI